METRIQKVIEAKEHLCGSFGDLDDPVDAWIIHCWCAIWGLLLAPIFIDDELFVEVYGIKRPAIETLLWRHIVSCVIIICFAFLIASLFFFIVHKNPWSKLKYVHTTWNYSPYLEEIFDNTDIQPVSEVESTDTHDIYHIKLY